MATSDDVYVIAGDAVVKESVNFTVNELMAANVKQLRLWGSQLNFDISLGKKKLKETLCKFAVDFAESESEVENDDEHTKYYAKPGVNVMNLTFDEQMKLKQFDAESEKERLEIKERMKISDLEFEKEKLEVEERMKLSEERMKLAEYEFELKKLELTVTGTTHSTTNEFRVDLATKLVNRFNESDVDTFFINFEKIANSNKWPKSKWSNIIQSQLIGKAAKAYFRLSVSECSDYDILKSAILKAYEYVPQHFNLKFRNLCKRDEETYSDFCQNLSIQLERWLKSCEAASFDKLKELVLLEQYLNKISKELKVYFLE
jgi:hypothetical protein